MLDSTDMHQEGLIFPGTKVVAARRARPRDHRADPLQLADARPGARRHERPGRRAAHRRAAAARRSLAKFGRDAVDDADRRDPGPRRARRPRAALATLPQGSWTAVDWLDDDGITDDPVRMEVTVTIGDGRFVVDFAGSSPATRGPVNMPFGATIAIVQGRAQGADHRRTSRPTPGTIAPLEVRAEPGTLFHAVYPAPTFTQWTGIVALELIYKALAQGMPDRLPASLGRRRAGVHDGRDPSRHRRAVRGQQQRRRRLGRDAAHDGINADEPHLRERRPQHADRGAGGPERDALRAGRDACRLRRRRAVPRRVRAAARHRVRRRRGVPVGHQEDEVAAVGAGRRARARGQPGGGLPRHRARAAGQHQAASGCAPATGSGC